MEPQNNQEKSCPGLGGREAQSGRETGTKSEVGVRGVLGLGDMDVEGQRVASHRTPPHTKTGMCGGKQPDALGPQDGETPGCIQPGREEGGDPTQEMSPRDSLEVLSSGGCAKEQAERPRQLCKQSS